MERNRSAYRIAEMARTLKVSRSGYYSWRRRYPSDAELRRQELSKEIQQIFQEKKKTPGSPKITAEINRKGGRKVNHKTVEKIMRQKGLRSKTKKKYKATTYSDHRLPVADNILSRDFTADAPCEKMVSDITYIPTDEGWLYLAAVLDLCGRKVIGASMDGRMTKELCMAALEDAVKRSGDVRGCILHSDRGSQYCSAAYREMAEKEGFIVSMSRKGNCWDNAPMESFWGKLKQEWLNGQHFKTREEARAAVFEYIWIFYNRKRLNEADDYQTPEEYYKEHSRNRKAA